MMFWRRSARTPRSTVLRAASMILHTVQAQFLPHAIEWVWKGYTAKSETDADATFLTEVIPGIAASIKIIEYAAKNASDEKVRDFAERVAKQHKGALKTASEHAKRLKVEVVIDLDKDSKEMIDKLSKLKGTDLDVAFLKWLSHIHEDTTLFDSEVKNGADADLKTFAKNSINSGNEHLKEARELVNKMKK